MEFGASITAIRLPTRRGIVNAALSHSRLADYRSSTAHMGAIAGRYAGRIDQGQFKLGDRLIQLERNASHHHLHGGSQGLGRRAWTLAGECASASEASFHIESLGGEGGHPGALHARATYRLADPNILQIVLEATADADTIVNLTQHCYFNLGCKPDIRDHHLQIAAPSFLPLRENLIPCGHSEPVAGTPFDFRVARPVGAGLDQTSAQLRIAGGFDHTFIPEADGGLRELAVLHAPDTNITMRVRSDSPTIHLYSGNYLDAERGPDGQNFARHAGLCLEAQAAPNSPNMPHFPKTAVRAGETFRRVIEFEFSW